MQSAPSVQTIRKQTVRLPRKAGAGGWRLEGDELSPPEIPAGHRAASAGPHSALAPVQGTTVGGLSHRSSRIPSERGAHLPSASSCSLADAGKRRLIKRSRDCFPPGAPDSILTQTRSSGQGAGCRAFSRRASGCPGAPQGLSEGDKMAGRFCQEKSVCLTHGITA